MWTIPSEPLKVPDWLGVDHFAAYPQEWPRRIILGWSPSGICVECGEGRRPVVKREFHGTYNDTEAQRPARRTLGQDNERRPRTVTPAARATLSHHHRLRLRLPHP